MKPALTEGVARLLYNGKWVDAITDQLARETAKFVEWTDGAGTLVRPRRYEIAHGLGHERVAEYEDALGRRWRQLSFVRRGIVEPMIVKVYWSDPQHITIENQDKSLSMLQAPSGPLVARLNGKGMRFFNAEVSNGIVELGEVVADQKW